MVIARVGSVLAVSFAFAAALQLAGCAGGADSLDRVEQALDLLECFGADTRCQPTVATETLVMPVPRACEGEVRAGLRLEPLVDFSNDSCATRGDETYCSGGAGANALAADGTLWTLGHTIEQRWTEDSIWVRRYGPEGERLGVSDLSPELPFAPSDIVGMDLALDEHGSARAVMYEAYGYREERDRRAWLVELDDQARVVGEPVALGEIGGPAIALASEGRVLIVGSDPEDPTGASLTQLDARGRRVWTQTDVRRAGVEHDVDMLSLVSDAAGGALVVSQRTPRSPSGAVTYGVARFDSAGNVVWDRALDTAFHDRGGDAYLVAAADGGALVSATRGVGVDGSSRLQRLARINLDGGVDWVYELESKYGGALAVDPQSGEIYVGAVAIDDVADELTHDLVVISPDGERCTRFTLPQEGARLGLALTGFDQEGRLFANALPGYARVQLPEE